MPRVRRNVKASIGVSPLEGRFLLSNLPTVAPPALIFVAPPSAPRVIAGPMPIQVPAPYPSTTQGPAIVAPAPGPPMIDPNVPLPAQLTDPRDPIQSGDPLRIAAPPRPYPTPEMTAPPVTPKSVEPPSSGDTVPVPTPAIQSLLDVDQTRGIAPPSTTSRPEFPVSPPPPPTPPPPIGDIYKEMDRIRRELAEPPKTVPPQIQIQEVPATWQDYWDQIKELIPYIPSPANTPMPILP